MRRLLFVHGVANAPDAPIVEQLTPVFRDAGFAVEVELARWSSTGGFFADGAILTLDSLRRGMVVDSYRGRSVAEVTAALEDFIASDGGVVVGHSFGTPLIVAAYRALAVRGFADRLPPLVFIGSPFSHPILGRWLDTLQLASPPPGPNVVALWNRDDPITCALGVAQHPPWVDARRITVDAPLGANEHAAALYFGHEVTLAALSEAFDAC